MQCPAGSQYDGMGLVQSGQTAADLKMCVGAVAHLGTECGAYALDLRFLNDPTLRDQCKTTVKDGQVLVSAHEQCVFWTPLQILTQLGDQAVASPNDECKRVVVTNVG